MSVAGGGMFVFGKNDQGQLGLEGKHSRYIPVREIEVRQTKRQLVDNTDRHAGRQTGRQVLDNTAVFKKYSRMGFILSSLDRSRNAI